METQENQEKSIERQLQEQFAEGLDREGAVALAQRVSALEGENADLKQQLDGNAGSADRISELEKDNADLRNKLDAAQKAAKAGKAATGEKKPGKPRKLGPIANAPEDAGERAAELRERIADADQVEILFADGDRDSGLPPAVISGEAWAYHARGLKLTVPLDLHGPGHGGQAFRVTGYALLIDGKQVAWADRLDPVQVGVGQHIRIEDDIFF
ncbi:hypothetical protein FIM10_01860 [Sphingomonadales bacterium 56]|nr:hypothetical protein [Sphingobium sp. S8]MBY2927429.1 hypothetical protein [Sphingomonadales bacterium 56]MBY2957497.1 hypothetical protein [Sphingomonadales bacterium 58]CAD7335192.1 hypothetical protein SPHS6_00374 [Sphingobium sp. S6]MBY2957540.1 hypothetical protein [Sphingomonadales bacterium 58]CAD7335173.1 hypothetical protein SPHS8_00374 [Sphingobium sp. S8]